MKIKDMDKYNELKDNNNDYLGHIVLNFTEKWADIMENEIENNNKSVKEIALSSSFITSSECGNMTGLQVSMASQILDNHWIYGGDIYGLLFEK
jgi:hypothetical protein